MIKFIVYGEPVAQGRPRATTVNGRVRMYDPKKSRDFKHYLKLAASKHRPEKLLKGPISLVVKVYKPTLKSFSKKKKAAAEAGQLRPTTKPDVSNYLKLIEDALTGVIWKDDSQIIDCSISKYYSETPRTEIQIKEMDLIE
ncbi:RusA family crossover junction endodeoxyribonuclease [Geobacillus stearothermophilus]|uniref:RusA family crossover junction endodeoxyribonuclease n=1 Tax=Geobacillus stearothermophilus TaxID=1422 RepID=UPI002E20CFBB|nr:RusA family crossover junction endodeoxyribonuclease [Geobacillus stearothermophilus]MED3740133.1 RusA family crossover junction endodeoxyribonuclease [Geobacillus stearothermophilus]MED3765988.1 RusA family crossover junction endodeoxyribonuclease [Geobacillus stearothermophilus]MED3773711.1 RusA family crossover junction endodeoxyribonuclease [Geobacillus stearothermophilus]